MTDAVSRRLWAEVPRWLWPVLIGSIGLNLVAAGSVLGHRLRPPPHGPAMRMAQPAEFPVLRDLSPERRAQMRTIFEASRGQNRALFTAVRERRTEVSAALAAEPFDQVAYVAAAKRLIEAESQARIATQPTFAQIAGLLSAAERQDFLNIQRRLRQHIMGPGRDGGPARDAAPGRSGGPEGDGQNGGQYRRP